MTSNKQLALKLLKIAAEITDASESLELTFDQWVKAVVAILIKRGVRASWATACARDSRESWISKVTPEKFCARVRVSDHIKRISKLIQAAVLLLASRKDEALKKYPALAKQIKFFIEEDPSRNQKYLDWSCMILDSGQALEREISDVVKLFDKYSKNLSKKDINQYSVKEFTGLRGKLFDIENKRSKTKEDYKLPADCKSEVIYDSENFLVRRIINKSASIHFGLGTKWCITMKDKTYFEDDDSNNVVFFFIFNKQLTLEDTDYKLAVSVQRDENNKILKTEYWNSKDVQLDSISNQLEHEKSVIESKIEEAAKDAPKSLPARLFSGECSEPEIKKIYEEYKNKSEKENLIVFKLIAKAEKTPEYILIFLSSDSRDRIREELAQNQNCTEPIFKKLSKSIHSEVHLHIVENKSCPPNLLREIYEDYDNQFFKDYIRYTAIQNPNFPVDLLKSVAAKSMNMKYEVVKNSACPVDLLRDFSKIKDATLRVNIALHNNCPKDVIDFILENSDKVLSDRTLRRLQRDLGLDET